MRADWTRALRRPDSKVPPGSILEISLVVAYLGEEAFMQRLGGAPGQPWHKVHTLGVGRHFQTGQSEKGREEVDALDQVIDSAWAGTRLSTRRNNNKRHQREAAVRHVTLLEQSLFTHEVAVVSGEDGPRVPDKSRASSARQIRSIWVST